MNLPTESLIQDLSNDRVLRVKHVARGEDGKVQAVALFDCTAHRPEPVFGADEVAEHLKHGRWAILTKEAQRDFDRKLGHLRSADDIRKKKRERWTARRDANWAIIAPIHRKGIQAFDSECRREALQAAVEARGKSRGKSHSAKWIERLLYRFWESGNLPTAVGPQNFRAGAKSRAKAGATRADGQPRRRAGANTSVTVDFPGGVRKDRGGTYLTPPVLELIPKHVDEWLKDTFNQQRIKVNLKRWKGLPWGRIAKAINASLGKFEQFKHIKVTRRQVQYLCKEKVDIVEVFKRCRGHRKFNLTIRPLNGDYRDVAGYFGRRYEVDTFIADIHIVDDETGVVIGRPRVYLVVDTFSGFVVGVYVTINETDYCHVARALHAAFSNMADFAALFGLNIDKAACPVSGVPEEIGADNKELVTKAAQLLPELVDVGIARAYRGDDKGTVEVTSSLLQSGHIMLYREGCTEGPKARGEDDAADRGTISAHTFTREILRYVIGVHNHRVYPKSRPLPKAFLRTKLSPTPFNVAKWSLRTHGNVLRPYDARTMLPRLLPAVDATISRRGLEVLGLVFELPTGLNRQRAASVLTNLEKLRVHYDPLDTNQVYIVPKDISADPIKCPLSAHSRQFLNQAWEVKRVRDEYVEKLRRLGQMEFDEREAANVTAQREALLADTQKLKETYGTLHLRNAVATQLDQAAIASKQLATDNIRHGRWMHDGLTVPQEEAPPTKPEADTQPTAAPAATPAPSSEPIRTQADYLET